MGKTTGGFAVSISSSRKSGQGVRLGRKHPAILPHDRSTVGFADPAHPGPRAVPQTPAASCGVGETFSGNKCGGRP